MCRKVTGRVGGRCQAWDRINYQRELSVSGMAALVTSEHQDGCWAPKSHCDAVTFPSAVGRLNFFNTLTKWPLNKDKNSEARWVIFIVCKIQ